MKMIHCNEVEFIKTQQQQIDNQWFFFIGQKSVKKFYTGLEIGFLWLCGGEYTCLENENKFNSELKFNELWTICFTKTILKSDEAPKFLKFVWWKNM